jgi:hypothetical protein
MSEFRIGSRVVYIISDREPVGELGTVLDRNFNDDDRIESVTIRWDDGKVWEHVLWVDLPNGESLELVDVTPKVYVNIYLHNREYGGPEEGGWWYDSYTPSNDLDDDIETGHFTSTEAAEAAYQKAIETCQEENRTRRSPSSVISEGHYEAMLEAWPAAQQPEFRPYYQ